MECSQNVKRLYHVVAYVDLLRCMKGNASPASNKTTYSEWIRKPESVQ